MTPTRMEIELLARQAGGILRIGFGRQHQIDYKGEIDLVTETDRQSEEFLLNEIQRRFPEDKIIAEESGELPGDDNCAWYVDPLDGTVNFAHGIPIFSVSIAYAANGKLSIGVVYDPVRDECFSAEIGEGAWLNGCPIRVSNAKTLVQSLLVTGFPYDIRSNHENNLNFRNAFILRTQGVRRLGSAALDLCYVAAGRLDGYWELSLGSYDLAAGVIIAEEAGAIVTNVKGGSDYFTPPYSVLAANPKIHQEMLKVIRELDS